MKNDMISILEIDEEFQKGDIKFHTRAEHEIFCEVIKSYKYKHYASSASLGTVLYEKIFLNRLVRETCIPDGFIPSEDNLKEQLDNLIEREQGIVDGQNTKNKKGLSFWSITKSLVELKIITSDKKNSYDDFYKKYRNPISHGLSYRLYCELNGRPPSHSFELDMAHEIIYKTLAERIINKVYELIFPAGFLKK